MSYGAQCSPPVGETASLLVTVLQSFICQVYKLTDIKYYGISFSAAPTIATITIKLRRWLDFDSTKTHSFLRYDSVFQGFIVLGRCLLIMTMQRRPDVVLRCLVQAMTSSSFAQHQT